MVFANTGFFKMQSYIIDRGVTRFLMSFLKSYKLFIGACLAVSFWWGISMSLEAGAVRRILNQVTIDGSWEKIKGPFWFYAFIILGYGISFRIYDLVCLYYYPKLKQKLFLFAAQKTADKDYHFYQDRYAGDLVSKVKDVVDGSLDIVKIFFDYIMGQFFAVSIAFFALWEIQPLLCAILLTAMVIILGPSAVACFYGKRLSKDLSSARSAILGKVSDSFMNFLTVLTFAQKSYERQRLHDQSIDIVVKERRLRGFMTLTHALQMLGTTVLWLGSVLVMIFSVNSHNLTVGDFGFVFTFIAMISAAMWTLSKEFTRLSECFGLVQQGLDLLNLPIQVKDKPGAQNLVVKKGEIVFQNVSFRYPGAAPLFAEKDVMFRAGEKVGLVGYSGSGKSTFVNLLLRLYDVQQGAILIDGQDIRDVKQESLHEAITYIPQDPLLFHRTLRENISYGSPNADDEAIIKVAKAAHADHFIQHLPEKYDTCVGERGLKLSGGQRQRIAIARGLLKKSKIVVMDEATSALDSVTETLVQEGFAKLMQGKTALVIAHRLSTLKHMDRILVLDKGKIVQEGTLEELKNTSGHFQKLWQAQIEGLLPEAA